MELATRAIFGGEHGGGMEIKQKYDPNMFEDPGIVKGDEIQLYRYVSEKLMIFLFYTAMQLHCATLEALALDKPMVDHIVDTTKPNVDMINKVNTFICIVMCSGSNQNVLILSMRRRLAKD